MVLFRRLKKIAGSCNEANLLQLGNTSSDGLVVTFFVRPPPTARKSHLGHHLGASFKSGQSDINRVKKCTLLFALFIGDP